MFTKTTTCAAIAICLATSTPAQTAPTSGCYERIYSAAHLEANPDQGVESIRMNITDTPGELYVFVALAARMSSQGQARTDRVEGQVLEQYLFCPRDEAKCYVECDAGSMEVLSQTKDGLTFRTGGMVIGDGEGCGGQSNLAETGSAFTTYRLNAVAPALCEGLQ